MQVIYDLTSTATVVYGYTVSAGNPLLSRYRLDRLEQMARQIGIIEIVEVGIMPLRYHQNVNR